MHLQAEEVRAAVKSIAREAAAEAGPGALGRRHLRRAVSFAGATVGAYVQSTEVHARSHRPPGHRVIEREKTGIPGVRGQVLDVLPELTEGAAILVARDQISHPRESLRVVGKQTSSHDASPLASRTSALPRIKTTGSVVPRCVNVNRLTIRGQGSA